MARNSPLMARRWTLLRLSLRLHVLNSTVHYWQRLRLSICSRCRGGPYYGGGHYYRRGPYYGPGIWIGPGWGPWWWGAPYYPYYPYYSEPVVIQQQPSVYVQPTPQQEEQSYWYYCPNPQGYYPYVKQCPKGWMKVVPSPVPQDGGE